jgi:hypothetical protein
MPPLNPCAGASFAATRRLEGFPDSDRAEAKRHNNTHSGETCDPLKPDLWHLSGKGYQKVYAV